MTEPKAKLDGLRGEIDEIDAALHDLIMRRTAIVEKIAEKKGKQATSGMRLAREIAILRRLAADHRGRFPVAALVRMWREMISSLTAMQGPYAVAVYAGGSEQGYWDLARDHFGSHTLVTAYSTRRDVLTQVSEGGATHGVLPFPSEHDDPPWWGRLSSPNVPRIVLRLPFAGLGNARGEAPEALVIARVAPEPTGDDHTLMVVETSEDVSNLALTEMLGKAKLAASVIASHEKNLHIHLVDARGFLTDGDVGVQLLSARDQVHQVALVGAYPAPLDLTAPAKPD